MLTIVGSLGYRKIMVFLGKPAFLGSSVSWDAYYRGILTLSENHGLSQETSVPGIKHVVRMLLSWDPYVIRKPWSFSGNQRSWDQACRGMLAVRFAQSATLYQRTCTALGSNNAASYDAQGST